MRAFFVHEEEEQEPMLKIALLTAQLTVPAQQEVAPQPPPPSLTPPPQTYIDTQGRTVTVSPQPGGGFIATDSQGRRTIGTEDGMLIELPRQPQR
jgi:hypothetical protein